MAPPTADTDDESATESIEDLRRSFFYGSRSNLNFKFLKDLSDAEFGDFVEELLAGVADTIDDGDAARVVEIANRWQVTAYRGHLGDPSDFPHRFDDTPFTAPVKPLADSRVALLTSSGHFVDGDDPEPFGVVGMTQQEAEDRITEFIAAAPDLSAIPTDMAPEALRVRHGGYPVTAVASDHQVALPLGHLATLAADGVIGEVAPTAYSFVGATSQVRLRNTIAAEWAQRLRDDEVDVVLLVPV